jgi:hypothetical protein
MQHFDPADFVGVVLDESSILKSFNGSTRTALIESFKETPFRLCATATPAPNDFTELGNHSEFLGVKTRTEMLAEYFVHDMDKTQDWRIKGHATSAFWKWIATWGAVVRTPADLGHDDTAYRLPPLRMHDVVVVSWRECRVMNSVATVSAEPFVHRSAVRGRRALYNVGWPLGTSIRACHCRETGLEPMCYWEGFVGPEGQEMVGMY